MKTYFKLLIVILFISVIAVSSYGQTNRFVNVGIYNSNLVKYLLPEIKGSDTIEIISFIGKPSIDPESAFRMIRCRNQFTLEARFCKKNYWQEIFPYFGKKEKIPAPEISFYRFDISTEFANKLILSFREAVNNRENRFYETVDGISYVFTYKDSGAIFTKTIDNPRKGDSGFDFCETSSKLAKEIKNQAIDESKYPTPVKRVDISGVYHTNLAKHLLPAIKGPDTTEIISFTERPSFAAESAFRIIKNHDQYTLEGRFCKKNYWYEIIPYFKKNETIPPPEISLYTIEISKEFANRLISAFHEEVNKNEKPEPEKEIYETINGVVCKVVKTTIKADGVLYVFSDKSSGATSSKTFHSPFKDEPGYSLCMTASKLVKDLRNQTFEESKYIDMK